jgi:plasmid stabilization system protein ParE
MHKTVILPAAKQDIRTAAAWYNEKQRGLGKRFTNEVREKLAFIQKNPEAAANRYKNVRTATLDLFPFMIHYRIDEEHMQIVVVAVFHTSMSPDRWNR